MARTAYIYQLPDELVAGILARLPPRRVAQARLVCRWWNALTTDHHFLRTSFSLWHAGRCRPVAGFFFNHILALTPCGYFPLKDSEADEEAAAGDRFAPDVSVPSARSADPGAGRVLVHGSCHGLLMLSYGSTCYVYNPLTKKLSPIVKPRDVSRSLCVNLAFNPSKSCHYKIIALADIYSIHVYSSETRSWRMAIHSDHSAGIFQGLHLFRGVFWNGSVVWIVKHSLVRFIIEDEHLTNMPMPPRKKDWICAYIGESGGHLQMIGYTKKDKLTARFDILEMQGYQSEWSVLYCVDLSRVKELYPNIEWPTFDTMYHQHKIIDYLALSPIYVIQGTGKTGKGGLLIFSIPGKIMSYNMEDKEISMVKQIESPCKLEQFWYSYYAYSPSLFDP